MSPFEHTVTLIMLHRPLGESIGVFTHPPALDALASRTYIDGRLTKVNGVPLYKRKYVKSRPEEDL